MVSRHDDDWPSNAVEEAASFGKFAAACALGQITADGDNVGTVLIQALEKRFDFARIVTAEVEIGNVRQRSHVTLQRRAVRPERTREARTLWSGTLAADASS